MKTTRILFVLLSVAVWAVSAQAQLPTKQVLTLDTAIVERFGAQISEG